MKKLRPLGDITDAMEPLLEEMIDQHGLQKHEIQALIAGWVDLHRPGAIERYTDGNIPIYISTHPDSIRLK